MVCLSIYLYKLVHICTYLCLYLTISTEQVLILNFKLVHHLVDACMMQPEPAVLPPRIRVGLSQGRGLSQTGHHAHHPPSACFAKPHRVEVADRDINGLHLDLVLDEAPSMYTTIASGTVPSPTLPW
jgi:hypothetical protein